MAGPTAERILKLLDNEPAELVHAIDQRLKRATVSKLDRRAIDRVLKDLAILLAFPEEILVSTTSLLPHRDAIMNRAVSLLDGHIQHPIDEFVPHCTNARQKIFARAEHDEAQRLAAEAAAISMSEAEKERIENENRMKQLSPAERAVLMKQPYDSNHHSSTSAPSSMKSSSLVHSSSPSLHAVSWQSSQTDRSASNSLSNRISSPSQPTTSSQSTAADISSELPPASPALLRKASSDDPGYRALRSKIERYAAQRSANLLPLLGEGSYAQVYLANDTDLDKSLALKFYYRDKVNPEMLSREITALRHLPEHPNIVRLYWDNSERLRKDKHIVSAFEYVHGRELFHLLKELHRPFDEDETRAIMLQILHGIDHCHQNHIVHRDLKPDNVLLSADGVVKIIDFGLCAPIADLKLAVPQAPSSSSLSLFRESSMSSGSTYTSPVSLSHSYSDSNRSKLPQEELHPISSSMSHVPASLLNSSSSAQSVSIDHSFVPTLIRTPSSRSSASTSSPALFVSFSSSAHGSYASSSSSSSSSASSTSSSSSSSAWLLYDGAQGGVGHRAPETELAGKPYLGPPCDVFSAGVLMFSMLFRGAPFSLPEYQSQESLADSPTFQLFSEGKFDQFWAYFEQPHPSSSSSAIIISAEAKSLLMRLLDPNPATRITISEVFQHPWFHSTRRWNHLEASNRASKLMQMSE